MRWESGRRSDNVEDRRGMRSSGVGGGGVLMLLMRFLPLLLRTKGGRYILGIGAVAIVGAKFLGVEIMPLLLGAGSAAKTSAPSADLSPEQQRLADFVSVVLADTVSTWHGIFGALGKTYKEPTLVLFSGSVQSACGSAQSAMGPFYCPADQKVYIDLSFYRDLKIRHKAPGDFAQAYVIAHEVGHHVQTLLGASQKVHAAKKRVSKAEANVLSVRQELQADCFAGLWGHSANVERQMLDTGDLEEALVAASAIGDDRLQQQSRGKVVPESFTHGTSEQRVRWFKKGFLSGEFSACDTFKTDTL